MLDNILTEEEIQALYSYLSLEWEDMDKASRESWERILTELENKIDIQNEKSINLRN